MESSRFAQGRPPLGSRTRSQHSCVRGGGGGAPAGVRNVSVRVVAPARTCLMKISRRRLWPQGLYLRLNLSNLRQGGRGGGGVGVGGDSCARRSGVRPRHRNPRRTRPQGHLWNVFLSACMSSRSTLRS